MTSAIQFDYQFGTKAVKIHNKVINALLPLETDGIFFQKAIPQLSLPRGHFLAELFGIFFVLSVVFHAPPGRTGHPPRKRGGQGVRSKSSGGAYGT